MMPTLTALDPAIFGEGVLAFAAERGVTDYLSPLYELARSSFDGADIIVALESDHEIPGLRWIAFDIAVSCWDVDQYRAARDAWGTAFIELCPPDVRESFALGVR